jgi:hypothetical protein
MRAVQTEFSVVANKDQVDKVLGIRCLEWVAHATWPNRVVHTSSNFGESVWLYTFLQRSKMAVLKNWP